MPAAGVRSRGFGRAEDIGGRQPLGCLAGPIRSLSVFEPDAFDHSMDVAQSGDNDPGATGDVTTVGQQHIYDPGHAPVVTWRLSEDPQTQV
jgi:hypothetical protein